MFNMNIISWMVSSKSSLGLAGTEPALPKSKHVFVKLVESTTSLIIIIEKTKTMSPASELSAVEAKI